MNLYEKLNDLYDSKGFLEKYGGSLVMTIIIILVFFILISYYYILSKMDSIQQNWAEEKCNPTVLPFAGLINPPPKGSAMDYTEENFNQCINKTLEGVAEVAMEPVHYSVSLANDVADGAMDAINKIRDMTSKLRSDIANFSKNVMSRILNIMMPLLFALMKMKDGFQKVNGIMGTTIFALMGAYDTLRSLFNSIGWLIVAILIIIWVVINIGMVLASFLLTSPIGVPMVAINTIFFLLILIPFILIEVYMGGLLQLSFPSVPTAS